MIMSYWSWPAAKAPSSNDLEPRNVFNQAEENKKEPTPTPAPANKKVAKDGTISGYVCLIHKVEDEK